MKENKIENIFKKGDLVKVDHKSIRGFVMRYLGEGWIDIFCEGEHQDYRAQEKDCLIAGNIRGMNIFDILREKGII